MGLEPLHEAVYYDFACSFFEEKKDSRSRNYSSSFDEESKYGVYAQ